MPKEKPAEMCLSKKLNELDATCANGCRKKHPSTKQIFFAVIGFVTNFGRVLKFIDTAMAWFNNDF